MEMSQTAEEVGKSEEFSISEKGDKAEALFQDY